MEIRNNETDQNMYINSMDFNFDANRNLWVVFRSGEKCTYIKIAKGDNYEKGDLDFEGTPLKNQVISYVALQERLEGEDTPIWLYIGFWSGGIARINLKDQTKEFQYWNFDDKIGCSYFAYPVHRLKVHDDSGLILAQHGNLIAIYSTKGEEKKGCQEQYRLLTVLNELELFLNERVSERAKEELDKSTYEKGLLFNDDHPEISYAFLRYRKPLKTNISGQGDFPSRLISAVRFNCGCISDIKLMSSTNERQSGISCLAKLCSPSSDNIDVGDTVIVIASTDGYLRLYSLLTQSLISCFFYKESGISSIDFDNFDTPYLIIGAQDSSQILIDLEKSSGSSFCIHESFVTFVGFYQYINKRLLGAGKTELASQTRRIISSSLDGTVGILDLKIEEFTSQTKQIESSEAAYRSQWGTNSTKKTVIYLFDSIIAQHFSIDDIDENPYISIKKRLLETMHFGASGGMIRDKILAICCPTGTISLFEFTTKIQKKKKLEVQKIKGS